MSLTLLETIAQVTNEVGIDEPSAIVSSSNLQVKQLLAFYNRVGWDLVRDYEWRRLVTQYVFPTSTTVSTTGTTTLNSAVITSMGSTASVSAGMVASGSGIPSFANVLSVDSGTQITLDMVASSAGTGSTLTFATQDYALPSGFDRMISNTQWDRTDHWMNLGPKSSQEWQYLNGGVIATGPRFRYRTYGNKLRLWPAPTTVYNIAYEYVSNYWVVVSGGSSPTKAKATADTDTSVFPDDVMVLGIKWQWYKTNNLDYATPVAEFMRALSYAKAQDQDNPTLSLNPIQTPWLVNTNSIPDGSWNNGDL